MVKSAAVTPGPAGQYAQRMGVGGPAPPSDFRDVALAMTYSPRFYQPRQWPLTAISAGVIYRPELRPPCLSGDRAPVGIFVHVGEVHRPSHAHSG